MKKNLLQATFVFIFGVVAGYGVYSSQKVNVELSDVELANIEALAGEETSKGYKYVFPGSHSSVACVCSGEGNLTCCY